ncbi:MAG: class I tRNA ligase family protein [bacterium]|nr:class I tRNA ligase family protein [bacterium]
MRYNPSEIEPKWQKQWLKEKVYEPDLKLAKNPFYNLMMFPYPSGEGLHVGHAYTFSGADLYGRYQRMRGCDVFQPIGYDSFGINSENYALKTGTHPLDLMKKTTDRYEKQLKELGIGYAWDEVLSTHEPDYYKWTQWIFVQMFKNGLAYRKKASVNWCPGCKTVLADEQVVAGTCERCDSVVIKKELEQWFFKITDYAEKLLKNLDHIDWSERIKIAQKNWIGKSEGASIRFSLIDVPGQEDKKHFVEVFTTRPDTIFGTTFVVVSPELAKFWQVSGWQAPDEVRKYIKQKLEERQNESTEKNKSGIFSGFSAVNPANKEKIPVWISDYVLAGYGTGAIMAVPAHDERDFEFAKKFKLPVSNAPLVSIDEGIKKSGGIKKIQFRLRDWLISRQRYWGPPIPMIFCEKCQWQPVPEKDLPVKLPYIKDFKPTGTDKSPLATDEKFYKVRCPKCNEWARRETDVSDTFLDSAWYYLGYLGLSKPFDEIRIKKWLPVDMYIGGAEHAVLHLLYVRFLAMAFKDWELVHFEEPFKKFRAHGLLIKDGAKMSKSRGNVVNPDEYIRAYGADALRMYLLFLGPFEQGGDFSDTGIKGITRFLERVWKLTPRVILRVKPEGSHDLPAGKAGILRSAQNDRGEVEQLIHKTIKKVTNDIENLQYNTAISALMILLNKFEEETVAKEDWEVFLKLLAPFAPHITEEIWCGVLKNKKSIHKEKWPEFDPAMLEEDTFELIVQINGKFRGRVSAAKGISEEEAKAKAASLESVKTHLTGKPKKVIFVPDKLINFVL